MNVNEEGISLLHSDEESEFNSSVVNNGACRGEEGPSGNGYDFKPDSGVTAAGEGSGLDFPDIPLDDSTDDDASDGDRLLSDGDPFHITTRSKHVVIKRRIGLIHAVAMLVGTVIGSGIFISPIFVLKNSGSVGLTMIIWSIGGVLSLLGALCYCELGTILEKSGGEFIYLNVAYGRLPAFLFSWVNVWFLDPIAFSIKALTFSLYFTKIFNISCEGAHALKLVAVTSICIFSALNCVSVRLSARAQVLFTAAKLIGVGTIVVVGFLRLVTGQTQTFEGSFTGTVTEAGLIGHAFYSVMWAYDGWSCLGYITEEVIKPEKNFIRCVLISVPLITLCYILINIAYFSVLSKHEMLSSSAVAFSFAAKLHPVFGIIMPLVVCVSVLGSINASVFQSSRILFSIAREKHMPEFLSLVNRSSHSPIPAIMLRCTLATLMLFVSSVEQLLNWLQFVQWIIFGSMFAAVLLLRWKKPDWPRPYRVFLPIPIVMLLCAVYFTTIPFLTNPRESAFGLAVIFAGIPVYYVFLHKKWIPKIVSRFFTWVTYISHLLCNVITPATPKTLYH